MPSITENAKLAEREFNREGVHDALAKVPGALARRRVMTHESAVVQWDDVGEAEPFALMPVPGSVMVWFGRREGGVISRLEMAYANGDIESLRQIGERLADEHGGRGPVSVEAAVDQLIESESVADLRYHGEVIAQNLFLDGKGSAGVIMLPYNGVRLDPERFEVRERVVGACEMYDVLVVCAPPRLSRVEEAALRLVPPTATGLSIGNGGTVMATPGALVVVAAFAAVNTCICTVVAGSKTFLDRINEIRLTDDRIRELGSIMSAAELLAARTEVFQEYGVR